MNEIEYGCIEGSTREGRSDMVTTLDLLFSFQAH